MDEQDAVRAHKTGVKRAAPGPEPSHTGISEPEPLAAEIEAVVEACRNSYTRAEFKVHVVQLVERAKLVGAAATAETIGAAECGTILGGEHNGKRGCFDNEYDGRLVSCAAHELQDAAEARLREQREVTDD